MFDDLFHVHGHGIDRVLGIGVSLSEASVMTALFLSTAKRSRGCDAGSAGVLVVTALPS
jgi:hypothetical protein